MTNIKAILYDMYGIVFLFMLHITNTLSIENLTKMMYNIILVRKNVVRIIN